MKIFSKLLPVVAALSVFAIASPVLADSPGQLGGGSQVYIVKNITQKTDYAKTANAACGEEVQYSIRLHNAAFGGLTDVVVTTNLANGTMTAVPAEGASAGTSGSVTVNVASGGTLTYENGTTILYDVHGNVIKTLPDTITTSGVNIGDIKGSTTEFVNYRAKVTCPTTPPPTTPPAVKGATTIPNTGPGGAIAGLFAGASAAGMAGSYAIRRLRRS